MRALVKQATNKQNVFSFWKNSQRNNITAFLVSLAEWTTWIRINRCFMRIADALAARMDIFEKVGWRLRHKMNWCLSFHLAVLWYEPPYLRMVLKRVCVRLSLRPITQPSEYRVSRLLGIPATFPIWDLTSQGFCSLQRYLELKKFSLMNLKKKNIEIFKEKFVILLESFNYPNFWLFRSG